VYVNTIIYLKLQWLCKPIDISGLGPKVWDDYGCDKQFASGMWASYRFNFVSILYENGQKVFSFSLKPLIIHLDQGWKMASKTPRF